MKNYAAATDDFNFINKVFVFNSWNLEEHRKMFQQFGFVETYRHRRNSPDDNRQRRIVKTYPFFKRVQIYF